MQNETNNVIVMLIMIRLPIAIVNEICYGHHENEILIFSIYFQTNCCPLP
jgi:hypothetical protein